MEVVYVTRAALPCRFLWGDRFLRATPALITELLLQCD